MKKTIVDMPKVTQMLDAGWQVMLFKGSMNSYVAVARHPNKRLIDAAVKKLAVGIDQGLQKSLGMTAQEISREWNTDEDGGLLTDDFTPEQALTRMAYKVLGEII